MSELPAAGPSYPSSPPRPSVFPPTLLAVLILGSAAAAPAQEPTESAATRAEASGSAGDASGPEQAPSPEKALAAHYQFALGKLHADAGEFEEAVRAFGKSTELDSSDPYNFLEAAKFYGYLAQVSRTKQQQKSYLEQSLELLGRARSLSQDNPDILRLFAETHLRLGEQRPSSYAVAQGAYEKLRELDPTDLRTLTSLGQLYLFGRDAERAADVLTDAARYSPRNRVIQSMLVDALLSAERDAEAEKALADLIPLEPSNPDHRLKLAELRSERGDHAGAAEALEDSPDGDWLTGQRVRQTLAREYHLAGRHEESLALIEKILLDPFSRSAPSSGVQRLKAAVLSSLLRYREAIEVFTPIVDKTEDDERRIQDALLLSRLHERVGDFSGAMNAMRRQLPTLEDRALRARVRLTLGTIAQRGRILEVAAEEFRDVIDMAQSPEQVAAASQGLAEVLDVKGQQEAGDRVIREAIEAAAASENRSQLQATLRLGLATRLSARESWAAMGEVGEVLEASEDPGIAPIGTQIRADSLVGLGRVDEALALIDALEPQNRQTEAKRVALLFDGARSEAALEILETLAQESSEGKLFAARLLQRQEMYEESIPWLEAIAAERKEAEAERRVPVLFALGASYERTGQREQAVATFGTLLELDPDDAQALNYLGYMW
ncbi:MAG: tetratricopeptide repeat protein, partial [Acidobacteriota bacterium]